LDCAPAAGRRRCMSKHACQHKCCMNG
jgi:hypothetical protein